MRGRVPLSRLKVLPNMTVHQMPPAHLTIAEASPSNYLTLAVRRAFDMAMEGHSQLNEPVFDVQGFSGRKFRMFLNNLFATIHDPRYLEIGVFNGGSFIPAIYRNKMKATALDNWSWEGTSIDRFKGYLAEFKDRADVTILNQDFKTVDFSALGKFNVLFYDGDHAYESQLAGVKNPSVAMDDNFILIVDDWNWSWVRKGTFEGLREAGCRIDFTLEIRTSLESNELPSFHGQRSDWHNGMFAAVVSRDTF